MSGSAKNNNVQNSTTNPSINNFKSPHPIIELRHVTTFSSYGKKLLDNLCLKVCANSKITIASLDQEETISLIELLSGLKAPDNGSILYLGKNLSEESKLQKQMRQQTFLNFMDPWLFKGTIRSNLTYGSSNTNLNLLEDALIQSGVAETLKSRNLNLNDPIHLLEDGLSTNEKRRINVVRTLLYDPKLVIFQEPLKGLRTDEATSFLNTINSACENRSSIIFCNNMKMARHSDQVLILDSGKLAPYSGGSQIWNSRKSANELWKKNRKVQEDFNKQTIPSSLSPEQKNLELVKGTEFIPGYTLTGLVNRNPDVDTWVAWSSETVSPVRIKVPRSVPVTQRALEMIASEYTHLSNWTHVNLARAYKSEFSGKLPYSVLEYIDSKTIAEILSHDEYKLSLFDLACIGHDLSTALKFIHKNGFVHTRLSTNIVRKRRKLWVLSECENLTEVSNVFSNQESTEIEKMFEAPEVAELKEASFAMDVYSLGKVLYSIATGNTLNGYERSLEDIIPTSLHSISSVIAAMLRVEPNARPSMERVHWEFKRVMSEGMLSERVSEKLPSPINYQKEITLNSLNTETVN